METIPIYISFVVALFGVAYPILLQVVTRLDEQYSSILIVELFQEEKEKKYFVFCLIISLISIFIWSLKTLPLVSIDRFNFLIGKFKPMINDLSNFINIIISLLIIISTVLLVVSFFFFVKKILIYLSPNKYIKYLIGQYNQSENIEYKYFRAISDIFLLSIKKQNETLARTISDFMYFAFKKEREKFIDEPVEYPEIFYSTVNKTIEELAILKNKKFAFLEYHTIGGIWLLGELKNYLISKKTYNWLGRNLLLSIQYENDDMVLYHWRTAHQYFHYFLQPIFPEYSNKNFEVTNNDAISKREEYRKRFIEFHYYLGGVLLYKKRYDCISRIFSYTDSNPPNYVLLPDTMDEIFKLYIHFVDPYDRKYPWISQIYFFPEQDSLLNDDVIKKWICTYIALLFLRQYTISHNLLPKGPLELPEIPKTQDEKRGWIDYIDYFKKLVEDVRANTELLSKVGFDFLTENWCKENGKPNPYDLLNSIKNKAEEEYERGQIEQGISEKKINIFNESTNKIITETIQLYNSINNPLNIDLDYNNWFIQGIRTVIDKSAFIDGINYNSFLAESISYKYKDEISVTFFLNKSVSYLLKPEDIFPAIDKLNIDDGNHIIIGFHQNLDYYKNILDVKGLQDDKYKNIELINYEQCNYKLLGDSFFILKKDDLPKIIHKKLGDGEIEKYSYNLINEEINLYTSVIDLNRNTELQNETAAYKIRKEGELDLRKSALMCIGLLTEVRWKKNIELIQIKTYSKYIEKGIPDNLKDVKTFKHSS